MKDFLSPEIRDQLRSDHRRERDRRKADRIKAVILSDKGYSYRYIAEVLMLDEVTISKHVEEYLENGKLKPENGGSPSLLDSDKTQALIVHLEENIYQTVEAICAYVKQEYGISYSVSGMTDWLNRNKFSYKKPKRLPAKADAEKQEAFKEHYAKLMKTTPEDEPILFGDGVHPTMETKLSYGWIRQGHDNDKMVKTTSSKWRMNWFGTIDLESMKLVAKNYDKLNSISMAAYFAQLRRLYPDAPRLHLILDQGPYNKSKETRQAAKKHDIVLHFLPPYSPNLNPIERVWKVMNEKVRNNTFFDSFESFQKAIQYFFETLWDEIAESMKSRINDNFQTLKI